MSQRDDLKRPQTLCWILESPPSASPNPNALLHHEYFIGIDRYRPTSCIDLLLGVHRYFIKIPIRCTAAVVSLPGVAVLMLHTLHSEIVWRGTLNAFRRSLEVRVLVRVTTKWLIRAA